MVNCLKIMENMLSDEDKRQLKAIYAPVRVAIPPGDARRDMCVMKTGEIRHYGAADKTDYLDEGKVVYITSKDCGLSWKRRYASSNNVMGASTYLPWCDKYVTVKVKYIGENKGMYALISDIGPDDEKPKKIDIWDEEEAKKNLIVDIFQPVFFEGSNRIFVSSSVLTGVEGEFQCPVVMYSDDDGETWTINRLKSVPVYETCPPHKNIRWQNTGTEPTITKMPDGRLAMLARTSHDYMYIYYSQDNGTTWTDGEKSIFHGTLTTPFIMRLSDGRNIVFWNNTQPLPEVDIDTYWPPAEERSLRDGWAEDVFTNRDAAHAAITSDFKVWRGFREILRNRSRNRADYRIASGIKSGADRSVQQFQAFELPFNKILVSAGQNEESREMVIFDLDWLYETDNEEDFMCGIDGVSTQVYIKSISGCQVFKGRNGHSHWNRTNGAVIYPSPDLDETEALLLCTTGDPRLFSNVQGVVWNYPMSRKGKVTVELRIEGEGVQISLTDRWFNPIDTTIDCIAQVSFPITGDICDTGMWKNIVIKYDLDGGNFEVNIDEKLHLTQKINCDSETGLSYIHIHTISESEDFKGTYIRKLHKEN